MHLSCTGDNPAGSWPAPGRDNCIRPEPACYTMVECRTFPVVP
jgi:hypothetical protein